MRTGGVLMHPMEIREQLDYLKRRGVEIKCRCPKPCMPHSNHYRNEAVREEVQKEMTKVCPTCNGKGKVSR